MSVTHRTYRTLRVARTVVAICVAALIAVGTYVGGWATAVATWLGDAQVIPAIMASAAGWVLVWTVMTLLVGRLYCSTMCPIGALLDLGARIVSRRPAKPVAMYRYRKGVPALRYIVAILFFEAAALGVSSVVAILDPYAGYMDIVRIFLNISAGGWAVSILALLVVAAFSVMGRGRTLCNTLCPVGAAMSGLGMVSLLRFDINPDLCIHCGRCERVCKSHCVDSDKSLIDNTRCVVCFNCASECPNDAVTWRAGRHRLQWPLMQRTVSTAQTAAPSQTASPSQTMSETAE